MEPRGRFVASKGGGSTHDFLLEGVGSSDMDHRVCFTVFTMSNVSTSRNIKGNIEK